MISIRIMLYIRWGKDGHVDSLYMESFEYKKFHSDLFLFISSLYYNVNQPSFRNLFCKVC